MLRTLAFPTILAASFAYLHKRLHKNHLRKTTVQKFPIDGATVVDENLLPKNYTKFI